MQPETKNSVAMKAWAPTGARIFAFVRGAGPVDSAELELAHVGGALR